MIFPIFKSFIPCLDIHKWFVDRYKYVYLGSNIWTYRHTSKSFVPSFELCPRHDIVTISSISCRYRLFYVDIVHTFLWSGIYITSTSIRYWYDIVMFLLNQLFCCQYRFNIDTISFCDCWMTCIAVDIVYIDTISSCSCWMTCIAVDIVEIDTISSCSCWMTCIAVDIAEIDKKIVSWLFDQLHNCRYRRYRYDIVLWLLDQLYCCRYCRYRYDIIRYRHVPVWSTVFWHSTQTKFVIYMYT